MAAPEPVPARRASGPKLMSPWEMDHDFFDGMDVIAPGFTHVGGNHGQAVQVNKSAAHAMRTGISGRVRRRHSPIRSPERSPIALRTCSPLSSHISPRRARPRARRGEGSSRSPQRSPVYVPSRPVRTISEELGLVTIAQPASAPESDEALARVKPLNICRSGDYHARRTVYNERVAKLLAAETGAHDEPAGVLEGAVSSIRQSRPHPLGSAQRVGRPQVADAGPKDLGEGPARCFKPVGMLRGAENGGHSEPSECEVDRLSSTSTAVKSTAPPAQALRCLCDHGKSAIALLILFALSAFWCLILSPCVSKPI